MKVTKAMIKRAENAHYRREDAASLDKWNALQYIYYKQTGKKKEANYYARVPGVKTTARRLEIRKPRRVVRRVVRRNPFGLKPTRGLWR